MANPLPWNGYTRTWVWPCVGDPRPWVRQWATPWPLDLTHGHGWSTHAHGSLVGEGVGCSAIIFPRCDSNFATIIMLQCTTWVGDGLLENLQILSQLSTETFERSMPTSTAVDKEWVLQESTFSTQKSLPDNLLLFLMLHEGLNDPKVIQEVVKHQNWLYAT